MELRPHVQDLKLHSTRVKHANNMKRSAGPAAGPLASFVDRRPREPCSSSSDDLKVAELRLAAHLAVHGSFLTVDHLTPVISGCFSDSVLASAVTLGRTKCAALVTKVLGPTFREELLKDMTAAQYSLIVDESTDVSCTKELAVVARFFSRSKRDFLTAFLGLVPVTDASAEGLFSELKALLDACKLNIKCCVGIGTDGASVMCGQHNSLYTKMKAENARLVLVKCVCHSLQLACSEAIDVLPTHIDYLVRETFNWFAHSPKRQQEYRVTYAAITSGDVPNKLIGVCATRWLSIAPALRSVLNQWAALRSHFDAMKSKERCYAARLLSEMYADEQNLLFLRFLSPIIDEFERMNKLFQCEAPDPVRLNEELISFVKALMTRVVMPGYAEPDNAEWEQHILHVRACSLGVIFLDSFEKSSLSEGEKVCLLERCRKFVIASIRSVLKRLPANMKLLSDLKLLEPKSIKKYSFDFVHRSFNAFVEPSCISTMESEYHLLQTRVDDLAEGTHSITEFWVTVHNAKNVAGNSMFPLMSKLALSLLSLPVSNAAVERVFSQVSLTKTDIRNRMSNETLEALLHVKFGLGRNAGCCKDFKPGREFLSRFNSTVLYGPSSASASKSSV